ncbi:MAG: 50S ribosomal protein L23 [Bacteroidota bacterium]|jgi:large subunit ribosomal protein L23|nr:50S ribosomal protein L23 [Bacteroidota bacterium]MDP4190673.1 50S ribosomal protein L23 [Bacteroidota bacterium]MDP4194071.1 50S ribosomal protein L23 [Bacteroidota bacterium]
MRGVLIRPLITEKMNALNEQQNKYGFIVDLGANKIEIARVVEARFNVKVEDVNTVRYDGKEKTQFRKSGRFTGSTSRFKKAIVTLKEGQKIDLFEEVK